MRLIIRRIMAKIGLWHRISIAIGKNYMNSYSTTS